LSRRALLKAIILLYVLEAVWLEQFVVQQESKTSFMRALVAAKKPDLVPCTYIIPYAAGYCTTFSFIVVQECNAA